MRNACVIFAFGISFQLARSKPLDSLTQVLALRSEALVPETGSTPALAAPPRTTRAGPVQAPAVGDPHTVTRCRQESINRRGRSCLTTAHRGLHAEPGQMVTPELGRRKVVSSRRRRLLHGLDRCVGRKIRWASNTKRRLGGERGVGAGSDGSGACHHDRWQ